MSGGQDDELKRLKVAYAKLSEQVKEARRVITLYRRWEHASDVECRVGDDADTSDMLIQASFAAEDFVDKWESVISAKESMQ